MHRPKNCNTAGNGWIPDLQQLTVKMWYILRKLKIIFCSNALQDNEWKSIDYHHTWIQKQMQIQYCFRLLYKPWSYLTMWQE